MTLSVLFLCSLIIYIHHCQSHSIHCNDKDQCFNESLICPIQENCTIHCEGKQSCSYSTVVCPESQSTKCTVLCTGQYSCDSIRVQAEHSLSLQVNITGKHALSYSEIFCPSKKVDYDCNITYIGNQSALNNINIYSVHNYNSINIYCSSIHHCWSNGDNPVLHYGDDEYSKQCIIYDSDTCISDNDHDTQQSSTAIDVYQFIILIIGAVSGICITICCCALCLRYGCMHEYKDFEGLEMVLQAPMLKTGNETVSNDSFADSRSEGKALCDSIFNVINGFQQTNILQPGEFVISDDEKDITPFV